ncbi:hypothetical protein GGI43DRAFT_420899 [Trichoderma evansii]
MANQDMSGPQGARKKRARTGCLRCRTRRRKCDERKPRCQRCLDADAECSYGPRLSFLQKNAITAPDIRSTPLDGKYNDTRNYSKIQFVGGEQIRQKDASPSKTSQPLIPSTLSPGGEDTFICDSPSLRSDLEPITISTRINEPSSFGSSSDNTYRGDDTTVAKSLDPQIPDDLSLHHHENSQDQNMMRQGDSFEIALDVLMTLGVGDHRADTPVQGTPNTGGFEEDNALLPLPTLETLGDTGPLSHRVAEQLSMGRSIELLRHYRYKIAPWLDICDTKQTFGLVIPHLAMRSDLSFDALLELCRASYKIHHYHIGSAGSPMTTDTSHLTDPIENFLEQSKPWEVNLWPILAATKKFLTDPPEAWDDALRKSNFLQKTYSHILESSPPNILNVHMLWLLARLGTAAALLKESSPFLNSNILKSLLQSSSQRGSNMGHTEYYAHETLALCAEVLEFAFGDQDVASSFDTEPPKPRAVRWKSIVNQLNDWYSNRPPIFHSVIELNDEKNPFPIIYFTNGTAVFANQLYHTAMMLILAHKPRTVQLEQRRTPSLSQLWHAHRICSIAINNNRCECWDPCLLASFYVAARQMTHESQHRELLHGFEHIGSLGWPVNGFIDQLKQEWNTSEPPTVG